MWDRFALVAKHRRCAHANGMKNHSATHRQSPVALPDPGAMRVAADRDLTMFGPAVALFAVLSLAASKYHDPVLSPPHLRYLDETRFCCVSTPSVVAALTGSYA